MATAAITAEREHYLNQEYGIRSWLLTTDHKRIALLYLISITFFFFIGGFLALLIRLELLTPAGDLVQADTYNKLFTMHGQIMVFFFLIPSIPAVLGNFLVPLMIGAKDLAFPRINLLSWYLYIIAGVVMVHCLLTGGVDTGWTFYTPFSTAFSNTKVIEAGSDLHRRLFIYSYGPEFRSDHSPHARSGHDLVAAAAVHLGDLRDQHHTVAGNTRARDHSSAGRIRTRLQSWHL